MSAAEVLNVGEQTLGELAQTANREHRLAFEAGGAMVEHAIRCGDMLLAVRARLKRGEWLPWVEKNFDASVVTATNYMRVARHQEVVSAAPNLAIAFESLRAASVPRNDRHEADMHEEARTLRAEGLSYRQIGEALGVTEGCAYRWCDSDARKRYSDAARERYRRRAAEKRALRDHEKTQSLKKALVKEGQAFNEVYAMLTRMDDLLGQARSETEDREKRRAISEMHALRNKMRDMAHAMLGVS